MAEPPPYDFGFPRGWRQPGGYWYGQGPAPDNASPPWGAPPPPFPDPAPSVPLSPAPPLPHPQPPIAAYPWMIWRAIAQMPPAPAPAAAEPVPPPPFPFVIPEPPPPAMIAPPAPEAAAPAAPDVAPGTTYLFPTTHATLHIIQSSIRPWELPPFSPINFNIFRTPTSLSIKGLLTSLGIAGDGTKIGVSECLEIGDGEWAKGTTILASDGRVDNALHWFGWDETRGQGGRPPIWLFIERG